MADANYEIKQNPAYETEIRALQDSDPARASSVFNPLIQTLIDNTHHVKLAGDNLAEKVEDVAEEVGDAAAVQANLSAHVGESGIHITSAERSKWDTGAETAERAKTAAEAAQATASAAKDIAESINIDALFMLEITFDESLAGKSFAVTGPGLTYNGIVSSSLMVSVAASEPSSLYTITCEGNTATVETLEYFGIYKVAVEVFPEDFRDFTWDQIGTVLAKGETEVRKYFSVGDEKEFSLSTGEDLTLQICGLYHDDLADGSGKAPITFGLKHLMDDARVMNISAKNTNGFTGSALYTWLTETLLPTLPSELRSLIKPVIKKTSAGNQSTTINSNSMEIFLFSEVECFGTITCSAAGEAHSTRFSQIVRVVSNTCRTARGPLTVGGLVLPTPIVLPTLTTSIETAPSKPTAPALRTAFASASVFKPDP